MHSLRSRGDTDFDEIGFAVPELEFAWDYDYGDLNKPQKYTPRMFRTHVLSKHLPKGFGKYVVVVR